MKKKTRRSSGLKQGTARRRKGGTEKEVESHGSIMQREDEE
jgi:hypothetical protein